jgi:hypothetical protein
MIARHTAEPSTVDVAFRHDQIRLIVSSITAKATIVQPRDAA